MKAIIIYYSKHHGNTKKLIDAIEKEFSITCIDASQITEYDLSEYDLIGFASGIYAFQFHPSILEFAKQNLLSGQQVFLLYTCASPNHRYCNSIQKIVEEKHATVVGSFGCNGWNTFGPFKLIGGTSKNHPDQKDLEHAVDFYRSLLEKLSPSKEN